MFCTKRTTPQNALPPLLIAVLVASMALSQMNGMEAKLPCFVQPSDRLSTPAGDRSDGVIETLSKFKTLTKLAPLYCEVKAISPGLPTLCKSAREGVAYRRAGSFRQKRETKDDGNYLQTSTIEVPPFLTTMSTKKTQWALCISLRTSCIHSALCGSSFSNHNARKEGTMDTTNMLCISKGFVHFV